MVKRKNYLSIKDLKKRDNAVRSARSIKALKLRMKKK